MRKSKAFTLVELLVVIGIIAVLISILLPALNKARQQANEVKCQSNMKQLYNCIAMYCNDNKQYLPYPNWQGDVNATTPYSIGWLFNANHTGWTGAPWTRTNPPADGMSTGALWPYNKATGIYHCPLYNTDSAYGTEFLTSYLMNGAVCSYGWPGSSAPGTRVHPAHKITKFIHPAEKAIMWEPEENFHGNGAQWNDGSSYPREEYITDRHYKGSNLLFFDGHVEWWTPLEFDTAKNYPQANALWCNPLSPDGH